PVPGVVTAALNYIVCQAETALICAMGMTTGAADVVARYAPESVRADVVGRLTSTDPDVAWEGGMFLTERQGGSDVGANTTTVVVPTGEVVLEGARAWLAGSSSQSATGDAARDGRGINRMMEMVNGSRFGVAIMGLGIHRRSFLEAAIYAAHREQWGQRIDQYPLVRETLVDLLVELAAGMAIPLGSALA